MVKLALAAALLAATLQGAQRERVFERAGLFGSCSAVPGAVSDAGGWMACRSGRLSGYPDLSHDSCRPGGMRARIAYWRCPGELVASRTAQTGAAQSR